MRLDYTLGPQDWQALADHLVDRSPLYRRSIVRSRTNAFMWPLAATVPLAVMSGSPFWLAGGLLLGAMLALGVTSRTKKAVGAALIRCSNRCLAQPHYAEALPAGLHINCPLTDSTTKWTAIEQIFETDQHIFFLIGEGSGYIVPRGTTGSDAQAFVQAARAFVDGRGA